LTCQSNYGSSESIPEINNDERYWICKIARDAGLYGRVKCSFERLQGIHLLRKISDRALDPDFAREQPFDWDLER